jgi:hypothetical protein
MIYVYDWFFLESNKQALLIEDGYIV